MDQHQNQHEQQAQQARNPEEHDQQHAHEQERAPTHPQKHESEQRSKKTSKNRAKPDHMSTSRIPPTWKQPPVSMGIQRSEGEPRGRAGAPLEEKQKPRRRSQRRKNKKLKNNTKMEIDEDNSYPRGPRQTRSTTKSRFTTIPTSNSTLKQTRLEEFSGKKKGSQLSVSLMNLRNAPNEVLNKNQSRQKGLAGKKEKYDSAQRF